MNRLVNWMLRRLPSFVIENAQGQAYLRRYYLVKSRWFPVGVYLHEIMRSDEDRDLHDHPWSFLSVILRGGYVEHFPDKSIRFRRPGAVVFHRAEDAHMVELPADYAERMGGVPGPRGSTWTLVFVGRKRRDWGFHCKTADGDPMWMHWQDYLDKKFGKGNWTAEPEFQGMAKMMD
ncbi:MAG: hypothetical protein KIS92_01005 [Planctomycetota bacterium]|nr:hypothetical protein [Planctomycetota bacterium]